MSVTTTTYNPPADIDARRSRALIVGIAGARRSAASASRSTAISSSARG